MKDTTELERAYRFYQQAEQDKDAIACGCLNDAYEWIFNELKKLFDTQN